MNNDTQSRSLTAISTATIVCAILVMAFGVGKLTGTLDPLIARRGVGAMLGVMLMVTGNFLPKMRLFQSATGAAQSDAIDRFAGWTFVLCGLSFALVFIFAPADQVFIIPPLIVLTGFLAVIARWLTLKDKRPSGLFFQFTPGRLVIVTLLATVLWTSAIFFADAIWGGNASRWMAIIFPLILIWLSAIRGRRPAEAFKT